MTELAADTLVLVLPGGVSLRAWSESGLLAREWALYEGLQEHYQRVVVVTYGDADDPEALRACLSPAMAAKVQVISNTHGLGTHDVTASISLRVAQACAESASVVVKTHQMIRSDVAVSITESLRARGVAVGLVARGAHLWTRFVAFEHGTESPQAVAAAVQEGNLCRGADVVVGTTREMVEDLAWRYGLEASRCAVVPNYVVTSAEPKPPSEREPGLLVFSGKLVARKRVGILIQAVSQLPEETRSKVLLRIVGDGPERANLEAMAKELGAPVEFVPRVSHSDLITLFSSCTLFVQASELEGHPVTVLEAMASGTAVLVANSQGLGSIVTHGMNGLRIEASPEAFATAIDELLRDADWREVIGTAAANTTRAEFGLSTVLPQELRVHQRALTLGAAKTTWKLRASA